MPCTLHTVKSVLCIVKVQCDLCEECSVQFAVCSVQYTVCSVKCAVCSVKCEVCSDLTGHVTCPHLSL